MRHLTWLLAVLGVILIGQFNELSFAFIGDGRLVSRVALVLCAVILVVGLRVLPRPALGLPMALLCGTLIYTLCIGVLVGAVSAPLADVWSDSGRLVKGIFTLTCVFVGMQAVIRADMLGTLAKVFVVVTALVVAYSVASFVLGLPTSIHREVANPFAFRYSGVFGNPNQAAMFCSLLLCVTLLSTFRPVIKVTVAGLALAGVVVTFSRGGLLTFSAVVAANALIGAGRGRVGALLALGLCGAIAFAAIPLVVEAGVLPRGATERVLGLYDLLTGATSIADNSRGELILKALQAIEERPIAGSGFGDYTGVLGMDLGTHNMYTHFALLAGIPAMLMYMASVLSLAVCAFRLSNEAERRYGVSIAIWMSTMGLSSHNLFDERYSVMLVAVACAVTAVRDSPPRGDRRRISGTRSAPPLFCGR